jgi:hypothetical protein
MFAGFVTHAILSPLATFALVVPFKFPLFEAGIAILQLTTGATLIARCFLLYPLFSVASVNDAIFAIGDFPDAIRLTEAVTAATHSRLAFVRFDIQARNTLPTVILALIVAFG